MSSANNPNPTLVLFLTEMRSRLLRAMIVLLILLAVFLYFANPLYSLLAKPLLRFLPQGHLIATQIGAPLFVPFRLAFATAFLVGAPFFLYQVWAFISPALYGHEKKLLWPFFFVSAFLFYSGIAFAYFIIFPVLFHFLTEIAPMGVTISPDIGEYLDFTLKLLLVFGALFEIPIIMMLLVLSRLVERSRFKMWRPYAIVGAFIIGLLLAPPDVISQTLLAVPVWLLYEAGIILSRFVD